MFELQYIDPKHLLGEPGSLNGFVKHLSAKIFTPLPGLSFQYRWEIIGNGMDLIQQAPTVSEWKLAKNSEG